MSSAPMPRRLRSIRATLTLWYTGTLLLLALSMSIFIYYRLQRDLTKQYDRFLKTCSADLAASFTERSGQSPSPEMAAALRKEVLSYRSLDVEYRVFDEKGTTVFATAGWGDTPAPPRSVPHHNYTTLRLRGRPEEFRATSELVRLPGGRRWLTQTAVSLEYPLKTLNNYVRNILFFTIPLLILGGVGGYLLARRSLRPAVQMADAARRISSHELSHRLEQRGVGDELDELAGALNEMLDRLEESFLRIERFSSDFAHELRTPITLLMGETEAALVSTGDAKELRHLLERHSEVYASMRSMINDLLELVRSGTRAEVRTQEEIDLPALLQDVVDSFLVLAEDKGVKLAYRADPPSLAVTCNAPAIRRMVSNLLDNAIRHTPKGGSVELGVGSSGVVARIEVRDTGEGIAEEDLPRIFERFYRADRSRARGTGGFGLGLSIVRQIVDQHDGTIRVESRLGSGTTFIIELPLGSPAAAGSQHALH